MKKILKMDGYLVLKHPFLMLLPFLLCCTAGAALELWLLARRGSGMTVPISLTPLHLLMAGGSVSVPFTILLEEKDVGIRQILLTDRENYVRAKYGQLFLTALACLIVGAAAFVLSIRELRPQEGLFLAECLPGTVCFLSEMLIGASFLLPFQLRWGAEKGMIAGLLCPLLPLHILLFVLSGRGEQVMKVAAVLAALTAAVSLFLSFRRSKELIHKDL